LRLETPKHPFFGSKKKKKKNRTLKVLLIKISICRIDTALANIFGGIVGGSQRLRGSRDEAV